MVRLTALLHFSSMPIENIIIANTMCTANHDVSIVHDTASRYYETNTMKQMVNKSAATTACIKLQRN